MSNFASDTKAMIDRPRHYDLIVFDWDGTLFDSTGSIVRALQAACDDVGVSRPSDRQAAYVIGLGLQDAMRHLAPGLPERAYPALSDRYRHHYSLTQHELSLFKGVLPMLQRLRSRQHHLAVATGKNRVGLNAALEHVDLKGMFDATRTADETQSKPHPQMLLELIDHFAVPPSRTLMVGDTSHDLQLALNAGTDALGISHGAHELAALTALSPRHVVSSIDDMQAWLLQHA